MISIDWEALQKKVFGNDALTALIREPKTRKEHGLLIRILSHGMKLGARPNQLEGDEDDQAE